MGVLEQVAPATAISETNMAAILWPYYIFKMAAMVAIFWLTARAV
jgi:hypothetical protein